MKRKRIAIVGLGRFGLTLAKSIYTLGYDVLGIDKNETIVQRAMPYVTQTIVADFNDEDAIKTLHLEDFDIVVIALGSDSEAKMLASLTLKEMGIPYLVVRATSELEGKLLKKIGVDEIVYPEFDIATRMAHMLTREGILDYFILSKDVGIAELEIPTFMIGKSLIDLNLRVKYGLNIVAIQRNKTVIATPNPKEALQANDIIIVIGTNEALNQLVQ